MKSEKQTEVDTALEEFTRVLEASPLSPVSETPTRITTTTTPEVHPATIKQRGKKGRRPSSQVRKQQERKQQQPQQLPRNQRQQQQQW